MRLRKWGLPQMPSHHIGRDDGFGNTLGAATYLGYQLGSSSQQLPAISRNYSKEIKFSSSSLPKDQVFRDGQKNHA